MSDRSADPEKNNQEQWPEDQHHNNRDDSAPRSAAPSPVAASSSSSSSSSSSAETETGSATEPAEQSRRDDGYLDPEALTPQISRISHNSLAQRISSVGTTGTSDPNFEVDWDGPDDPENPWNWPLLYRSMCITFLSWNTLVIVLYSTSYTSGIGMMAEEFNTSNTIVTLGLSFYLFGLAAGSVVVAPLSETYGRKPISVISMFLFSVMIIPAALAKSVTTLIVVRFIGAVAGSIMISSAPGMVADLVPDEHRAFALSIWSLGPINGPVVGPIFGGFVTEYLGWRWACWLSLVMGGLALAFSIVMKETYAPVLLRKKAARIRKETDDPRWWSRYDNKAPLVQTLKTSLGRPFVMAVVEPICIFWNLYIALVYGILYLCFTAYPIVFHEIRGWGIGLSGLAFSGIGIGSVLAIVCEPLIRRMINSHKPDPETGKPPPEAMVSMVVIGSILIPAGELWFAWTSVPASIPWPLPLAAGILFGCGNTSVFIYANNYMTHSYGIYAASAMAGNAVIRSILGGVMPLVGVYMYRDLGPNWSATLLGLLEVACIPIPVIFWMYGHKIRQKSEFIRQMQEDKKKLEGKRSRAAERLRVSVQQRTIEEGDNAGNGNSEFAEDIEKGKL